MGDDCADFALVALSPSPEMVTARSVRRTTDCLTTVSKEVLRLVLGVTGAKVLTTLPQSGDEDEGTGSGGAARNDLKTKTVCNLIQGVDGVWGDIIKTRSYCLEALETLLKISVLPMDGLAILSNASPMTDSCNKKLENGL